MNVLFEEDGAFKAGVVLSDQTTSLQVETTSGRRAKVKAANVLLRFASPAPAALLEGAETRSAEMEVDFLWEVCGDNEFAFEDLAREYYGHAPDAVESTAILLRLHAAPIYFHRKGRGRFRKAPPDILRAALAGLEKKRLQAAAMERMVEQLCAFQLPTELQPLLREMLYRPDRNKLETKALEAACGETGLSVPHLLARCGALPSSRDYHLGKLLAEYFPNGTGFADLPLPGLPTGLPDAGVTAFSIDDATTTEIDDAFSVTPLTEGGWRIGIHIAAPGLGIAPGSPFDAIARDRLSTVYMPGDKITMLPPSLVERFTLAGGTTCPALSLYLTVRPDYSLAGTESRIEQVHVAANLRHHDIEPHFNEETLMADAVPAFPFRDELILLWRLATVLEAGRGKPPAWANGVDYSYYVEGAGENERIRIVERQRGSPLDKLVSELMIVANCTWGGLLADHKIACIYRAQTGGKVRMTTSPQPHDGLGVPQYAWTSSPLRRYVDLTNQWQLIACLRGAEPHFGPRSEALLGAMRDFDVAYAAYADFQRGMERYWCLRWVQQEGITSASARVVREGLVRLEAIPLFLRMPSLPALDAGTRVQVTLEDIDLLDLEVASRYVETLATEPAQVGE